MGSRNRIIEGGSLASPGSGFPSGIRKENREAGMGGAGAGDEGRNSKNPKRKRRSEERGGEGGGERRWYVWEIKECR